MIPTLFEPLKFYCSFDYEDFYKETYENYNTQCSFYYKEEGTVELKWLKHLWDYENLLETGVVQAIEGLL